ncbi:MAG: hypothetical protein INR73_23650 [Williamsia sp.]|nr:hypothetical protein [Williamsia sp.]
MRNICLSLLLTASLATTSCDKENDLGAVDYPAYNQKYELRVQSGGLAGQTQTYKSGNGNAYLFESSSTYKQYTDGQLSKTGTYKIVSDSSYVLHQPASRIIFDNAGNGVRTLVRFQSNKMYLQEDVYDGKTVEYEKLN